MSTHATLKDFGVPPQTSLKLVHLAESGLPLDDLNLLKAKGLTFSEMAETVISPRTLKHRRDRGENLSSEETQRALRVASMIAFAEKVFGNPEKAMRWLREPEPGLEDRAPLSLLRTEQGGKLVESMLWGIADGIFS